MAVVKLIGVEGHAFVVVDTGVIGWCGGSIVSYIVKGGLPLWYLGGGKGRREAVVKNY